MPFDFEIFVYVDRNILSTIIVLYKKAFWCAWYYAFPFYFPFVRNKCVDLVVERYIRFYRWYRLFWSIMSDHEVCYLTQFLCNQTNLYKCNLCMSWLASIIYFSEIVESNTLIIFAQKKNTLIISNWLLFLGWHINSIRA